MSIFETVEAIAGRLFRHTPTPLRRYRRRRHRRMLRKGSIDTTRLRQAQAAWWSDDPRWYPSGTPPRRHNRVTPLIDGEQFFAALHTALTDAQNYVYVIGWCLTPHIPLLRGDAETLARTGLLDLLTATAQRVPVRVLLWSGTRAFIPPTRRLMGTVQRTLVAEGNGNLRCALDASAHFTHCHHQKSIVVDGQVAFVGGMDLTTLEGDRWDRPGHALRAGPTWHDVHLRIEGEAVADVEHNFRQRWQATTGGDDLPRRPPASDPSWQTPAQIVRTIPRAVYPFAPRGEFGIHHAYIRALRQARRLIYLENQYLWSDDVMDALIAAMNRPGTDSLRIVIVLPAHAARGKWDNDWHVSKLRDADQGRGIVSVYSLYTSGPRAGRRPITYRPTYVHAKVAIIDDEWLTVGSANLNDRGLVTDSEINVVVRDEEIARNLRIDLWAEHLALPREQVAQADSQALVDQTWVERAAENARIIQQATDPLICGIHRYEVGHMPGSWLLEEIEVLTFEH